LMVLFVEIGKLQIYETHKAELKIFALIRKDRYMHYKVIFSTLHVNISLCSPF